MSERRPRVSRARSGEGPNESPFSTAPRRRARHSRTPSSAAIVQSPPIRLGNLPGSAANDGIKSHRITEDTPTTGSAKTTKAEAIELDPNSTSSLELNIHSSDAFSGALVVTNLDRIPWGRAGDIVQLKPAKANLNKQSGPGGGNTSITDGDDTAVTTRKREMKGNYMFKLRGNNDTMLKRMMLQVRHNVQRPLI